MSALATIVAFALAAAAGAAVRVALAWRHDRRVPAGTLVANVAASFALGAWGDRGGAVATVVAVGLVGALGTWSGLANEVAVLLRAGRSGLAAAYLASSLVLGTAAAGLGLALT